VWARDPIAKTEMTTRIIACIVLTAIVFPSAASGDRKAECQSKYAIAKATRIIHRISVEPDGVHVVVDADVWSQSPYTTKLGLAVVVECSLVEPDERLIGILIHDHRTNKVVGRYRYPNLEVE